MHGLSLFYSLLALAALGFIVILQVTCKKPQKTAKRKIPKSTPAESETINTPQLGMIENDKATKERFRRYKDFESFYNQSNDIFEPFKDKDERTRYLQATHMLTICPGTRNGGRDKRYVEVFWGSKIYDRNEEITEGFQIRQAFYSEIGATLLIYKNDNGYASIYLKPAGTDITHPHESAICLKKKVEPAGLLEKNYQNRLWWAFMAYMEVTQLDGNPRFVQKLYIWYLRNFRHLVVNEKWQPIKTVVFLKKFGLLFLTVSFSGLAIFLLQLWLVPSPSEHDNVTTIKDKTIELNEGIDTLQNELKGIRDNQDSIILGQKHIQKILKNNLKK